MRNPIRSNQRSRIQKILIFAGLYAAVIAVPYLIGVHGEAMLRRLLGANWWLVPISVFGVLSASAPLLFVSLTHQFDDQANAEHRRYHKTLVSASAGMTRIRDVQRLCRLVVYVITRTVKLTHAAVFLYDEENKDYRMAAVRHRGLLPERLALPEDDQLVQCLNAERNLVDTSDLRRRMQAAPEDLRKSLEQAYVWMRKHEFRLVVPSFSGDKLMGFLALGRKRGTGRYTTDDIALFSALTNQGTLAIQNALFYEELRKNEAYMIQSEKLASLGQLASGMAHEIHNPLTIISGEAQLYLERFRGGDPQVDAVLSSIIEECRRAADITRRILRFAKPGRNDFVPVDIKLAVEDSLNLVGYQVKLEGVERVLELPDKLPPVKGNLNQLQEVFLNLIVNACHAMGEKGGRLVLSAGTRDGHVELKIRDTGPGIEQDKLKKIFDPFFTTKQSGTGLGLFVSQRIVQAHGGTMEVESEVGKGTCFTICLPADKG